MKRFLGDLYRGETHLDLVRAWRYGLALSAILIVASVASLATQGLSLGIDFVGGTTWELPANGTSVSDVRSALSPFGLDGAKIQVVGEGEKTLRVSADLEADVVSEDTDAEVTAALVEVSGGSEGDVRFSRITGSWSVPVGEDVTVEQVTAAVSPLGFEGAIVKIDGGTATVLAASNINEVTQALADVTGSETTDVSVSTVGPSWGDEITAQAQRALVFFMIAIAFYITIRLEWKMAIGALAAVLHDILITVGIYSIFQFEVTPATVIAFLTILGYSLYDTIVVYDKIRENQSKAVVAGRMTYTAMMNLSLNQVFPRSVNTTITSIIPVISLLVLGSFFLGAVTLQEFALALLIGLVVGAYSSIFVASPVVALLKEREPRNRQLRERLDARAGALGGPAAADEPAVVGAPEGGSASASSGAPSSAAGTTTTWSGNHPPRPRKKTKRK